MESKPILILGGGINGAAIARELILNGHSVALVERQDFAGGTTAYSSRLIHGGLRYLEYGELDLVQESLEERGRLLRLARPLVQPLRLVIPTSNRGGGVVSAAVRFLGWERYWSPPPTPRGLWLIRAGLWLYDHYAGIKTLEAQGLAKHSIHRAGEAGMPPVDPRRYHWLAAYSDAQVRFAERLVISMLKDAQEHASLGGSDFRLWNYAEATLDGKHVTVWDRRRNTTCLAEFEPAAIINATGAWVDQTLQRLEIQSSRLIGGTKGSHLMLDHPELRQALGPYGVYAEAPDGRPLFLLPFGPLVLVGTTDLPYDELPESAVASEEEITYLLDATQKVFPHLAVDHHHILLHYAGIRPLPRADGSTPGAITRRHFIHCHRQAVVPTYSIIGGKLTTCRSLAEETARRVLHDLNWPVANVSRDRPLPVARGCPTDPVELDRELSALTQRHGVTASAIHQAWQLWGMEVGHILDSTAKDESWGTEVPGTGLPSAVILHAIGREWVQRLEDLVERRLMVLYNRDLSRATLRQLAEFMVAAGSLDAGAVDAEVDACVRRLSTRYGRTVVDDHSAAVDQA
ncbi:MAG: glycerol-3-phosphate dehydrogenase [Pirellulaceae bacterium]|nr:MAG: glycerol-3-phosphate dehydrogenase [Pirellulaceae bacterium]